MGVFMSLRTRIGGLEKAILPPVDDPWDPVALAVRRRQEAAGLEAWYQRIRDFGQSIGEDPDEYLQETRRRRLEAESGPPTTMVLRMGRLHPLKPGEVVAPGTKTFITYG